MKYADIGATFYFSRTRSTYADDKITLQDEDHSGYANHGIGTDDVVAPGLAYPFCGRGLLGAAGLAPLSADILTKSKQYTCCVKIVVQWMIYCL